MIGKLIEDLKLTKKQLTTLVVFLVGAVPSIWYGGVKVQDKIRDISDMEKRIFVLEQNKKIVDSFLNIISDTVDVKIRTVYTVTDNTVNSLRKEMDKKIVFIAENIGENKELIRRALEAMNSMTEDNRTSLPMLSIPIQASKITVYDTIIMKNTVYDTIKVEQDTQKKKGFFKRN